MKAARSRGRILGPRRYGPRSPAQGACLSWRRRLAGRSPRPRLLRPTPVRGQGPATQAP